MQSRRKISKRVTLTKAQGQLMKDSLKKFLGYGLIEESVKHSQLKSFILKDALNSLILK